MSLSLGGRGLTYLEARQWTASLSYRYMHSDRFFIGDREIPERRGASDIEIHSIDVTGTYAFNQRYSVSLTLPFLATSVTGARDHDGVNSHTTSAGGLGDLRLVGNAWLLDPQKHPDGNIGLGLGVKAPTGDHGATDISHQASGPIHRPVSVSGQLGDGGWGIMLEMQAYKRFFENTYGYVAGQYLANPREKNGTETPTPVFGEIRVNSVPDQYMARAGLAYTIWPREGMSLTLGGRVDGLPPRDLIGGDDGFRIPGYTVSIEPGLLWTRGRHDFALSGPVRVYGEQQQSVLAERHNAPGAGGQADFRIIASYTFRF